MDTHKTFIYGCGHAQKPFLDIIKGCKWTNPKYNNFIDMQKQCWGTATHHWTLDYIWFQYASILV